MGTRNSKTFLALMVLSTGVVSMPAKASGLTGSTLEWQYYAGGGALANNAGSNTSGSFMDTGSGGGETFIEPLVASPDITVFNIDATDSTITFDYSVGPGADQWSGSPLSLAPTIYNGIAVDLGSAGSFSSVTIDGATNLSGFGAGDLSFTASQIEVNWSGLDFTNGLVSAPATIVVLDVTLSATNPAPEPGTVFLLLAAGVLSLPKLAARITE